MELKRILLIDDEEPYLFLNEYFLRNCNIQCPIDKASEGQEALDMIADAIDKPNLILLDMHMNGMNGLDFLAAFAKTSHCQFAKVFIVSSSELEGEKNAALAYKFVYGFINKPLSNATTRQILKHFVLE